MTPWPAFVGAPPIADATRASFSTTRIRMRAAPARHPPRRDSQPERPGRSLEEL
jgi:hypothetical protein